MSPTVSESKTTLTLSLSLSPSLFCLSYPSTISVTCLPTSHLLDPAGFVRAQRGDQQSKTYVVQFIVEAAGIAHWVPICIAPPERGGGRLTVSTTGACSSGGRLRKKKVD